MKTGRQQKEQKTSRRTFQSVREAAKGDERRQSFLKTGRYVKVQTATKRAPQRLREAAKRSRWQQGELLGY